MRRHALQVTELIDRHAKRDADFRIEPAAPSREMLDQVIELRAVSQHAEDDLRRQPRIARIERRRAREQQVGRVTAGFDRKQDVEGHGTGWRDGQISG